MKKAFTLAEVLITLAIIGIVAALTIPTLVSKNEKKQLYTQFMKTYNTLSNAMNLAVAENGNPSGWTTSPNDSGCHMVIGQVFDKILSKHLKIAKVCDSSNYSECMPIDSYKSLSNKETLMAEELEYLIAEDTKIFTLADGSSMTIYADDCYGAFSGVYFYFDTNGLKGPNIVGRDMHILSFEGRPDYKFGTVTGYTPSGTYESYGEQRTNWGNCDSSADNSSDENGIGCAARLLQEGVMNY